MYMYMYLMLAHVHLYVMTNVWGGEGQDCGYGGVVAPSMPPPPRN